MLYPVVDLRYAQPKDAEQTGAIMNTLNDLRAEWIETRRSLGRHIVDLENGTKIHPIDQDSTQATIELLERLKRYRAEVESWLLHLPTEAESGGSPRERRPASAGGAMAN
jgi:hypothetical protein